MEAISAIVTSLALGASATAGTEVVKAVIKDAYDKLKELIKTRYPEVSLVQLEQVPASKNRRAVVEEDLTNAGAENDLDLATAARTLTKLIQQQAPSVAAAIGVDLKDVEAANLRVDDITASGTGVKVDKGKISGDIEISGVRAGVAPNDLPKTK